MINNKTIVYDYAIVLEVREKARRFTWLVDDYRRVPVLVDGEGTAHLIGNDEDRLAFCDLLDAIMEARRHGLWPHDGLREALANKSERTVAYGSGLYGPSDWSTIVFANWDISHDYYQDRIDEYRRCVMARATSSGASPSASRR